MSVAGHSLPIHSAPMSNNVRYASDSDHLRHECEMTLCAISRHRDTSAQDVYAVPKGEVYEAETGGLAA
jgi:hypothetical protein